MATLAVRTLKPRDLPHLRSVRQRTERLDGPLCRFRSSADLTHQVMAALPVQVQDARGYVATVDGELCAYLMVERQSPLYQWELVSVAAGSPRLNANEDVCVELWSALIELAVRQAGQRGTKRLFASVEPDGPAYRSLRANTFEPFETTIVVTGWLRPTSEYPAPEGMRRQLNSDVWSIHQLYNQVTPRAVQFAEALTSREWDLEIRTWWKRLSTNSPPAMSFILDDAHGVSAYCRVERRHGQAMIGFMVSPNTSIDLCAFLMSSARQAGVGGANVVQIVVPGYAMEHIAILRSSGFDVTWERTRLVKHTTAPVVVRPQLVPVSAVEERERAIRGVPSLYRGR